MGIAKRIVLGAKSAVLAAASTAKGFSRLSSIVESDSYYPEKARKKKARRYFDNVVWLFANHEANEFYNLYGMDVLGTKPTEFVPYYKFRVERDRINVAYRYNQACILKDKRLFALYMQSVGAPIPETVTYLVYRDGIIDTVGNDGLHVDVDPSNLEFPLFAKGIEGECADGVFRIADAHEYQTALLPDGKYILQKAVVQHEKMRAMGPSSVNTCRIITCLTGAGPKVMSAVLRCGTTKSGHVDNWAAGGISVGISADGRLRESGFYKPGYGGRVTAHPDTGVLFSGFEIPFYEDCLELVLRMQSQFNECRAIGWDIAISESGPIIIEGNDNWEISLNQVCNGGLEKEWTAFVQDSGTLYNRISV